MKKWIALTAMLVTMEANAQLNYRMNDPFVFCTQGQDRNQAPAPCWMPLPPYTGNFMMMAYCDPPNEYGKSWTQDDYASLSQYQSICPQAITSGRWEDGDRKPESTPFVH